MVKDSKENQVIPVEDVVRKDLVEYQALSSNGSLLCNASAHDGWGLKAQNYVGIQFSKLGLEDWSSSNVTALSNWLGMPTVGFKAKILALLRKMKARKEVRG
ncbi:hypothetical protein CK203_008275 [Vitis vinifera]|uniref:Uncharacterized protein n=1 Tax=Vitis vinifera TaxID=29760 RepID=A0A438KNV6_VITVI|nr:hypothetical protein CK203_008275 [Vitis vinifera]